MRITYTNSPDESHRRVFAYPQGGYDSEHYETFHAVGQRVLESLLHPLGEVAARHGCKDGCAAERYRRDSNEVAIHVPVDLVDAWGERLLIAFARELDGNVIPIERTG